jgi:hypothetical protein
MTGAFCFSGRSHQLQEILAAGGDRQLHLGPAGAAPGSFSVEGLAIPEDDPAPNPPVAPFLERHLQTRDTN